MERISVASAPKTSVFPLEINPDIQRRVEEIYKRRGLSLADAVDLFFQQTLNRETLPIHASPDRDAHIQAMAVRRLMDEVQIGWDAAAQEGWFSEKDACRTLGVAYEP